MAIQDKVEATFKMTQKYYKLIWNIVGFNMIPFVREHPLFGPTVRLGDRDDSIWQLLMSKQRGEIDKLPSLGFRLVKPEDNTVWDICKYDITVRSRNGDHKLMVVRNGLAGGEEDLPFKFVKGALEEVFKNEDGEDQPDDDVPPSPRSKKNPDASEEGDPETDKILQALFKEPVLVVECDIRYTHVTNDEDASTEKSQEKLVIENIKQLLNSPKFSDVVLRAGGEEFPCHGGILCCRSTEFDHLIQEDLDKPVVHLDVGESMPIMKMVLLYIYAGELPERIDEDEFGSLYTAALKFGINDLADYCSNILKDKIRDKPDYKNLASDEAKFKKFLEYNKKPVEETVKPVEETVKPIKETVKPVKPSPIKIILSPTPNGTKSEIDCA